jgi:CHASE2 domain-containing sensor protein
MPLVSHPPCPGCGKPLVRKPAGRCPDCGAPVAAYVTAERDREERIEKVVAVISTILVVGLFVWGGWLGLVEGVAAYAVAGAVVWVMARKTFVERTREKEEG